MRPSAKTFLLCLLLCLATLAAGWRIGIAEERLRFEEPGNTAATGSGETLADPEKQADLSLLWRVWRLLQQNYVDPRALQPQKLVTGAIGGLVAGVGDPYTVFMPPKENREFHRALEGTLQGIGAELTLKDGFVTVVAPLKGSPAEKAGLAPGDVIDTVDGASLEGLTLNDVVDRVRGPRGTAVQLRIVRPGVPEPKLFTIKRDTITIPSVESRVITATGSQVGYVALNQFGDTSTREMEKALLSFKGKSLKGIVLDLRGNGGGYLDGAVDVVSMFLKTGEVVAVEGRGGVSERHDVTGDPLFPDLPLVVLIDQGTASASEITAGALQDHGRATVVGMKSFGKGTVQEVIDLPGGGSLRVTTAHWLTPKGKNLGKEGVQPDVTVERGKNDAPGKADAQLDRALQVVLKGK